MMSDDWGDSFKAKLDAVYVWPSLYVFKFIVPQQRADEVRVLFPNHTSQQKQSANGKYTSITFNMMMPNSDAVVNVYQKVQHIEGIIAL